MDAELRDFTRRALERNIPRPDIANALKEAGWADADIKSALDSFAPAAFPVPVPRPKPYMSAREVFLYLVLFAALYTTAYNLGALAFRLIDKTFPDPLLQNYYSQANFAADIRWNVSALIVAFPLFLFMFRHVGNAIARDPTKRNSRPRRWLTYITLFVAACSLTGDLTTLIYNVLGGELTIRFVLKVLTVAIIAGGAFAYFLTDIQKDER